MLDRSVTQRQKQELDRYITGNYGEDQFKDQEDGPPTEPQPPEGPGQPTEFDPNQKAEAEAQEPPAEEGRPDSIEELEEGDEDGDEDLDDEDLDTGDDDDGDDKQDA